MRLLPALPGKNVDERHKHNPCLHLPVSFVILTLAAGIFSSGCGGGDEVPRVQVSGQVLSQGKPLKNKEVMLNFIPKEGPVSSIAIKPDGTFTGMVTPGQNQVTVVVTGGIPDHSATKSIGILPGYTQSSSPLHVTVGEQGETDLKLEVGQPPSGGGV